MPWRPINLWPLRVAAVVVFTLTHMFLIVSLVTTRVVEIFEPGPNGEQPDLSPKTLEIYGPLWEALQFLSWPIVIPLTTLLDRLPPTFLPAGVLDILMPLAMLANSLVWGLAIWAVAEVSFRTVLIMLDRLRS
ncbi:MAG: hypothetical protein AAGA21_00630 [Pseudomonadota bacterium]